MVFSYGGKWMFQHQELLGFDDLENGTWAKTWTSAGDLEGVSRGTCSGVAMIGGEGRWHRALWWTAPLGLSPITGPGIKTPLHLLTSLQLGASGTVADWRALGDLPHMQSGLQALGKAQEGRRGLGEDRWWSPKKDQNKWGVRAKPQQSSDMQVL